MWRGCLSQGVICPQLCAQIVWTTRGWSAAPTAAGLPFWLFHVTGREAMSDAYSSTATGYSRCFNYLAGMCEGCPQACQHFMGTSFLPSVPPFLVPTTLENKRKPTPQARNPSMLPPKAKPRLSLQRRSRDLFPRLHLQHRIPLIQQMLPQNSAQLLPIPRFERLQHLVMVMNRTIPLRDLKVRPKP